MQKWIKRIDRLSEIVGKSAAWLVVVMTLAMSTEVLSRRLLGRPTTWAFDVSYMSYGAYFFLGSAYTLAKNAHVRGDIFYRNFSPRTQAIIDLSLYLLVFFPAMIAMVVIGADYFWESYRIRETSPLSPYDTPVYPLKAVIPIGAFLLLVQGVAQVMRTIIAIRTNRWHDQEREAEVVA